MPRTILVWILIIPAVLMYEQNKFTLKYERLEMVQFNPNYYTFITVKNFKYNRTQACINAIFQIKTAFENEIQIEIQAYKFASNEYREFPIRFSFDFCTMAKKNDFGLGNLFKCGNFTGCPLKKGTFHFCNWFANGNRFPPHIPGGSYMIDAKMFYSSVEVTFVHGYSTITYPEV